MRQVCRCLCLGLLTMLTGCMGYSNLVNSVAPAKQKPEVTIVSADTLPATKGESPFCPVAPPPPKPPIREVYMVMPEDGGKAGTVAVTLNDGKEVVLHGDYSAMSLAGNDTNAYVGDQAQLEKTFGGAVAALPKAPVSAILYFLLGKDELTPASKLEAENIYKDFVARQAPEIVVIGHTDTVGNEAHNDRLSLRRAERVKQSLVKLGVPAASILVVGKGEHELLVPTPDNTQEPRNRCAEINVR